MSGSDVAKLLRDLAEASPFQGVALARELEEAASATGLQTHAQELALRGRYLRFLRDRYQFLDLKGFGVTDRVASRLELLDLYVPLSARAEVPEGETWDRRDVMLTGCQLREEDAKRLGRRIGDASPVLELVARHEALIVLGDPGSGKTTLLKTLALLLAAGKGEELGMGDRLPVLVPISAYAKALEEDGDVRLDDFVAGYFHALGIDEAFEALLRKDLAKGRALLLLDGLDEVRSTPQRLQVMQRLVDFVTFHRQNGNRAVLTSRIVGYREVKTPAAGIEECTLIDFGEEEIATFVERWTAALKRQAQGATQVAELAAEAEHRDLLAALERNPGLRRLAANPLLLTILAVMKRQGVSLPDRRVELYDQCVKTLLSTWNRARSLGRPPSHELDLVATVRILAPLALWMHEVDPGLGLVKREELRRRLESIYADRGEDEPGVRARRFLDDVREHTGLLIERGPGEYGFLHRAFEEYLAAVAIALEAQGDADKVAVRIASRLGEPAWHEVVLLLVGYLGSIQQLDEVAGAVLERLITSGAGPPGLAIVLAGRALREAGSVGLPRRVQRAVIDALETTAKGSIAEPALRQEAGRLLRQLAPSSLQEGVVEMSEHKDPRPAARTVIAANRSAAIGGDASNNVIVTGDANAVAQQTVDLSQFLAALADLQRQVRASGLPAETVELVEVELADVEKHAKKPKPNRALLTGKLSTVLGLVKDAVGVGTALIPAVRQLGEWAARLPLG